MPKIGLLVERRHKKQLSQRISAIRTWKGESRSSTSIFATVLPGLLLMFIFIPVVFATGKLDLSFGASGVVTSGNVTNPNYGDVGRRLLLQSDGKVVVVGRVGSFQDSKVRLARYNADGSIDSSYGSNGVALLNPCQGLASPGGWITDAFMGRSDNVLLVSYCNERSYTSLSSVSIDGISVFATTVNVNNLSSVKQRSDGKIFVGGCIGGGGGVYVFRFNGDLSRDSNFGTDGSVRLPSEAACTTSSRFGFLSNGDVIVNTMTSNFSGLYRITTSGTARILFPPNSLPNLSVGSVSDFGIDAQDRLLVAGSHLVGNTNYPALYRFSPSGDYLSWDSSFDGDGFKSFQYDPISRAQSIAKLALQGDGKILISTQGSATNRIALIRLMANGTPDLSFGTYQSSDGMSEVAVGDNAWVFDMAIQANGRILLLSQAQNPSDQTYYFALLRFLAGPTVSGRVIDANGPVEGLNVNLDGVSRLSLLTDVNGRFSFPDLTSGVTYTLLPTRVGFTFSPVSRTYSNIASDQTDSEFVMLQCSYSLSNGPTFSIGHAGGFVDVNVAAFEGCPWTSSTDSAWLSIQSGTSGSGASTARLLVGPNNASPRQGFATVAGTQVTINQSGCTFGFSSQTVSLQAGGGSGSFAVNTLPACTWSATSSANWIQIIGGTSGDGSGNITFSVSPNTGPARTGSITAGGQTFTVTQESGCTATLTPTSINFSHTGGIGGFTLATNSACPWSASTPQEEWVVINNTFGTGNGSVSFEVLRNTGQARVGTINIGSSAFTVNQSAAPTGSIAGRIRYYFGAQSNISGVVLSGTGSTNVSGTSGADGTYSITGFGSGAYTLTPSKTGQVAGISSLDASLIARYMVGLVSMTPSQLLAADVSNNGSVSPLDAARIAQWLVDLPPASGQQNITGTWRFTPSTRSYESVTESLTGQDFTAMLMGDVTGNWAPPQSLGSPEGLESLEGGRSSQGDVLKAIGFGMYSEPVRISGIKNVFSKTYGDKYSMNRSLGAQATGDVIEVPISIADASEILGYQASITFDAAVLEPVLDEPVRSIGTLSTNFNVVANRSERGRIRLAAYGIAPVTGNGDLLVLRFRVKKPGAKIEDANLRFESLVINERSVITPLMKK